MKKLRIWVNSLNLFQQFLGIAFLTVAFFIVFFSSFVDIEIDNFVNSQMYSEIHEAQELYIASDGTYLNENIEHYVYSPSLKKYEGNITAEEKTMLENVDLEKEDSSFIYNSATVSCSVRKLDSEKMLISIYSSIKREAFKNSLTSTVINTALRFIVGLFLLFLVWIVYLIRPLNSIKVYLEKKKNGEIAELKIERHDEIGEVAEALISMNDELEKQNRIKEEMIQNISHDLKTPIATIKSYSESIKDGIYPYGTLEKSVDVITEHADRLEKKVYSLITFNKIGYLQDVDEDKTVNMAVVIGKAIMSCAVLRDDIEIDTNVNESVVFHGEEEPWRVVVENLLDNALRYAKSKVTINLEENLLEVINDGSQIEKDRLDKLFKPYEKGTKGKFGLGLSIVKRVTETYGYKVTGENTDDGVVFRVWRVQQPKKNKKEKHNKIV